MPLGLLETFAEGKPLAITVGGLVLDTDRVGPVRVQRGRRSADERPEAAQCSLVVHADALTAGLPQLGETLLVDLSDELLTAVGGTEDHRRRFTGTITDVTTRPRAGTVTIVGTGDRARAARIPIGDVPWPAELDGERAERILDALLAIDPTFTVLSGDPGTVTVIARDVDRQPAAALLDELAAFTGGDAWETRAGALVWRDARSRADVTPALTLGAGNVLVDPEFSKTLDGLVTDLTVAYGPVPEDGTQAEVRVVDTTAPITTLGARVATPLATEADAHAYAVEVVGRRSRPRWRTPDLTVDLLRSIDDTQRLALLAGEPGLLLAVEGLPSPAPWEANHLFVEGWTETYTRQSWRIALAVTPRSLTGAQARWIDVPDTYTIGPGLPAEPMAWATAEPFAGLPWIAAAGWWTEDVPGDRWADVPAAVRWDTYPTTVLWGDLA